MEATHPVLLTARDPALIEAVEASALALGVPLEVVSDSDDLAQAWPRAPLRLVAPEMAARAAWLGRQPDTALVGRDAQELAVASAELGYGIVLLPDAAPRLGALLTEAVRVEPASCTTIALVGASGGLGVSTMVAGLGLVAAAAGRRAGVVELAAWGGGIDLLVGAEASAGLRWSDLRSVHGQLGDVHDELVEAGGARFLALSREAPGLPEPPARRSVLAALRRSMDTIVIDAGTDTGLDADVVLLVVGADVRSVAAARMRTSGAPPRLDGLVVRSGRGRRLPAAAVADSLGVPLSGVVRDDPALPRLADLGQPPTSGPARRFRQDVTQLWKALGNG